MVTFIKIISAALILGLCIMSIRAGYGTITNKPGVADMFSQWQVGKFQRIMFGLITIVGSLMLLHPKTTYFGNYLIQTVLIFIVGQHIITHNFMGVLSEIPVITISFLINYFGHPMMKL